MLGYCDLLNRPSIERNMILESLNKKARWKNAIWARIKKMIVQSCIYWVNGDFKFISLQKIHSELNLIDIWFKVHG